MTPNPRCNLCNTLSMNMNESNLNQSLLYLINEISNEFNFCMNRFRWNPFFVGAFPKRKVLNYYSG